MNSDMPGDSPAALQLINSVSERTGGESALGGELRDLPLSDVWNGKLFAMQWGATTRYNYETKQFLVYEQGRWRVDITGEVDRRVKQTVESIPNLIILGKNQDSLSKHRFKLLEDKQIETMKRRARSEWPIPCTSDQFDTDPMLLPLKNGTIDLNSGELRPPKPEDMLMKQCPVEYDADAAPEKWTKDGLEVWQAGDRVMINYSAAHGGVVSNRRRRR